MSSSSVGSPTERSWVTLPKKAAALQPGDRYSIKGEPGEIMGLCMLR